MGLWDAGGPRGGRAAIHCGMLEGLGWEGCNALWGGGGPRGGRAAVHCGVVEDPGVGGPQCIVGCWRTQEWEGCNALGDGGGPRWEGRNALWDAGGPRGGRTAMHCGMLEDLGWED